MFILFVHHIFPLLAMRPYICTVFLQRDIVSFTASAANGTRWHCPEDMQGETDHSWATFTTLLVEKLLASVACACSLLLVFFFENKSKFLGTLLINRSVLKFQRWLELKT
jgi:hypothetical protein